MNEKIKERFTARMFAVIDVEREGSFDEAVVAIVPLPSGQGEDAEALRAEAIDKYQRAFGTEYLTLVPIAVDATAWNTDSLTAVPERFLHPSAALDEIGELLGLEDSERGVGGFFDPARVVEAVRALVAPRRGPPTLGANRPEARAKQHGPFCPSHHLFGQVDYDPCECDYASRSGLERPSRDASYHAGFRPWPLVMRAAFSVDGCRSLFAEDAHARWLGLPWGCAR